MGETTLDRMVRGNKGVKINKLIHGSPMKKIPSHKSPVLNWVVWGLGEPHLLNLFLNKLGLQSHRPPLNCCKAA